VWVLLAVAWGVKHFIPYSHGRKSELVEFPVKKNGIRGARNKTPYCLRRDPLALSANLNPQTGDTTTPLCTSSRVFRWLCRLNNLLHTLQQNGRSPICMGRCVFRQSLRLNDLLHKLQLMAAPYYICVDVSSDYPVYWMTYYTHCSKMVAPHCPNVYA
jgi:hypothetical protein